MKKKIVNDCQPYLSRLFNIEFMKDETEVTKETYNKVAKRYDSADYKVMEDVLRKFINYLGENGRKKLILDAGCGTGRDVKYFLDRGLDIIGIDFSESIIEEAKRRVSNGDFKLMDMRNLGFPDNTFDGIWACASLLHLPKYEVKKVLVDFNRVLKPKGILFVLVREGKGEKMVEDKYGPRFFAFYSLMELRELLEKNGFEIVEIFSKKDRLGRPFNEIDVFARIDK